jgi:hypothetical protein
LSVDAPTAPLGWPLALCSFLERSVPSKSGIVEMWELDNGTYEDSR